MTAALLSWWRGLFQPKALCLYDEWPKGDPINWGPF